MKLMQLFMGLDDCYQPIRSALLTRDPLPKVNDAYNTVSRKESHRGVFESYGISESKLNATSFAAKTFNNNKRTYTSNNNNTRRNPNFEKQGFNANVGVKVNDKQSFASLSCGFNTEKIQKLLSLINDNSSGSIHANMAGRASFFTSNVCDNQHLTMTTIDMFNVVDITFLKITIGHPNGTLATISHVGNLELSNNVILYDVLVVHGYRLEKVENSKDWYHQSKALGEHIHLDLWDPYRLPSREHFKYFLTIVDDFSRAFGCTCNTQPNPKGSSSKTYQPPQALNEHVNAVFTQGGKTYDPPINPNDQPNDSETPINFDSDDEDDEPTP
uniref:Uncharacterized protein n=1 Tax=Tanacetum cinerariifolium TaxID=118510 RepID=A0A6L2JLD8_TANCI|nr:hypothetical protein [Tanacetum cinerariifolium]